MATFVDIDYLWVHQEFCKKHIYSGKDNHVRDVYEVYDVPTFVVTYKFNPPDDSSEDDLVHSIRVHTDSGIKIGDPLPILYMFVDHEDDKSLRDILSMPFPLPLDNLFSVDGIIGMSTQKKK